MNNITNLFFEDFLERSNKFLTEHHPNLTEPERKFISAVTYTCPKEIFYYKDPNGFLEFRSERAKYPTPLLMRLSPEDFPDFFYDAKLLDEEFLTPQIMGNIMTTFEEVHKSIEEDELKEWFGNDIYKHLQRRTFLLADLPDQDYLEETIPDNESKVCLPESSEITFSLKEASSLLKLGLGRNQLYRMLKQRGIVDSQNTPYQKYLDNGCFEFRVVPTPIGFVTTTVVTVKGFKFLNDLFSKIKAESKE